MLSPTATSISHTNCEAPCIHPALTPICPFSVPEDAAMSNPWYIRTEKQLGATTSNQGYKSAI